MITETDMSLVERRQLALREAVATGDEAAVDRAARALAKARATADRESQLVRDRVEARQQVDAERRAAEKVAAAARADEVEAELRKSGRPRATIFTGDGRVVVIDLSSSDVVTQQFGVEAARRVCDRAAREWRDRVARSRQAGAAQPARDVSGPMMTTSSGLIYAASRGIVEIQSEVAQ